MVFVSLYNRQTIMYIILMRLLSIFYSRKTTSSIELWLSKIIFGMHELHINQLIYFMLTLAKVRDLSLCLYMKNPGTFYVRYLYKIALLLKNFEKLNGNISFHLFMLRLILFSFGCCTSDSIQWHFNIILNYLIMIYEFNFLLIFNFLFLLMSIIIGRRLLFFYLYLLLIWVYLKVFQKKKLSFLGRKSRKWKNLLCFSNWKAKAMEVANFEICYLCLIIQAMLSIYIEISYTSWIHTILLFSFYSWKLASFHFAPFYVIMYLTTNAETETMTEALMFCFKLLMRESKWYFYVY